MIEKTILTALCVPHGDPRDDKTKMGLPLILWGDPGIGKSERIEAVAEFLRFFMALVFPSTCAPEDFSGIPIPDGKGGAIRVCATASVRELCNIGEGILFIDEMTTVPASVQAALMGVVLNRRMGDIVLPPRVRPILAANPPETSAGGHDAIVTLANRCCHINVATPSVDEWLDWNFDHTVGKKQLPEFMADAETKVKDNWEAASAEARALVAGFIMSSGSEMLYKLPSLGEPARTRAWRSHRTWSYAQNALATSIALKSGEAVEDQLIAGCVGEGACTTFRTWRKAKDLPTPEQMLEKGWTPDKRRLDRSMYAYSALCGYVGAMKAGPEKLKAGGKAYAMMAEACDAGLADLIYRPGQELVKGGLMPSTIADATDRKAAEKVMERFKSKSEALRAIANKTP